MVKTTLEKKIYPKFTIFSCKEKQKFCSKKTCSKFSWTDIRWPWSTLEIFSQSWLGYLKTLKELPVLLWLIKKTSEILRTAGYYVCTQALNR